MPELGHEEIAAAVRAALAEDIGSGDATSEATIPAAATANAAMVAREPLIVAGLEFATITFSQVDPSIRVERIAKDGAALTKGADLLRLSGPARGILSAERVALNFVQRLSGVASATAEFVKAIQGSGAEILDTRKTTPGWRRFEKYAVACGGGRNHRIGLFDLVMIKDNHLAALRNESPNAIAAAVQRAREKFPDLKVEVEADELAQVEQAVAAGADIILLDNMPPEMLREAVTIIDGRAQTEASGGVTLSTVHEIASTGVNFVSVGAITHSVRAIDIGLDFSD
ncbi:MAG: nicotinate-nucleotide pyrophosphorylase (carboxylating) [Limisphaerales bacterium]|jgi:nicotinate-nucleotide pyrophosphorylase (carboxylating)